MRHVKKSIFVIFLAISMQLCIPTNALTPSWSYNDVKPGMWFYPTLRCLYEDGIMVGDGCGNLFPDRPVTRGELVALFSRIDADYQNGENKYDMFSFDDVNENQYYSRPIAWAKKYGIVSGISDNLFAPDAQSTREQFFKIVANYLDKIKYPVESKKDIHFSDYDDISPWAKESALTCISSDLVSGFPDGTLQPKGIVTRAQAAQVIYIISVWKNSKSDVGSNNGNISYCPPIQSPSYSYSSWEELYSSLENLSIEDLSEIQYLEKRNMVNTLKTTYVSEIEKKNGIFESVRQRIINKTEFLLPYYQNKPFPLNNEYGDSLELSVADLAGKPWITCHTTLGVGFRMMSFDPSLVTDANEKGASWLLSVLEHDAMNVYNYEEIRDKVVSEGTLPDYDVVVYEKDYSLQKRNVKSMVIDHTLDEKNPNIIVYFVYDDLLVCVYGNPQKVENVLSELSFMS